MSEERRKRKEERERREQPQSSWQRKAIIAVVVVAAFAAAYFLGLRKRTSRLDAFAQCLASKQVKMYGAFWCPHCEDQKKRFGSAFQYVSYVECGIKGSRQLQAACVEAKIKNFPTWQFPDGARAEGELSLQALADKGGCSLP
jgi:hypothetical protein